jgi:energy-coupling factor transporter ATP-binding protein EcfA2
VDQARIVARVLAMEPKQVLLFDASAGSGKSTALLHIAAALAARGARGRIVCFNSSASTEMTQRLRQAHVSAFAASTFHALGRTLLEQKHGSMEVNKTLVDSALRDEQAALGAAGKYMRIKVIKRVLTVLRSSALTTASEVLLELARRGDHDITDLQVSQQFGHAKAVMARIYATHGIDFDGMVHRAVTERLADLVGGTQSWVLVDEAQDMNAGDLRLIINLLRAGNHVVFCGDPFQSINGFRGAMVDAMGSAAATAEGLGFTCLQETLPVSYRLPTQLSAIARLVNPHIVSQPGAPAGIVRTEAWTGMLAALRGGDRVLSRVNAPLLLLASRRLRLRHPGSMRDAIFQHVANAVQHGEADERMPDVIAALQRAEERVSGQLQRTRSKNERDRLSNLLQYEASRQADVRAFSAGCATKGDVRALLDRVRAVSHGDDAHTNDSLSTVRLSTVHSAKGLEADRVFVILQHPNMAPPREFLAPVHRMTSQEIFCWYVAVTRAREELVFVGFDDPSSVAYALDWGRATGGGLTVPAGAREEPETAAATLGFIRLPRGAFPDSQPVQALAGRACLLCAAAAGDARTQPCGHTVMCGPCLGGMPSALCPICRQGIASIERDTGSQPSARVQTQQRSESSSPALSSRKRPR